MPRSSTLLRTLSILALLLVVFSLQPVEAQQGQSGKYYFETGHWVTGEFWTFIQSTPRMGAQLGYPLTEPFTDELTQRTVQYFQNGRLEYLPGNPAGQRVVRTPLGDYLFFNAADALIEQQTIGACAQEAAWSHPVCGEFLDFFNASGGETAFGPPLSPLVSEHGRTVQYFTYARIEWQPDAVGQPGLVLGQLGEQYFREIKREDPALRLPVPLSGDGEAPVLQITSLQVFAFPADPVVTRDGLQSLDILVHDQSGLPVDQAAVTVTVTFPDEQVVTFNTLTGLRGVARVQFRVTSVVAGTASVQIDVAYAGGIGSGAARTAFHIQDR